MGLTCALFFFLTSGIQFTLKDVSVLQVYFFILSKTYLLIFSIASIKTSGDRIHFQRRRFYIKQERKGKYSDIL